MVVVVVWVGGWVCVLGGGGEYFSRNFEFLRIFNGFDFLNLLLQEEIKAIGLKGSSHF